MSLLVPKADSSVFDGCVDAASEAQRSAAERFGDDAALAGTPCSLDEREAVCPVSKCATDGESLKPLAGSPCSVPAADESSARSLHSIRAERFVHTPRPLAKARSAFAHRFADLLHEHWVRGEAAYSKTAVARACDVAEKTVHEWCKGEKRMPPECIAKLPHQLFVEVMAILQELHGQKPKRALVQIREGMAALPRELAHEDKLEVVRALVDVQGQAAALMQKAMGDR